VATIRLFYRALLQKRPIIVRSLLIVAISYSQRTLVWHTWKCDTHTIVIRVTHIQVWHTYNCDTHILFNRLTQIQSTYNRLTHIYSWHTYNRHTLVNCQPSDTDTINIQSSNTREILTHIYSSIIGHRYNQHTIVWHTYTRDTHTLVIHSSDTHTIVCWIIRYHAHIKVSRTHYHPLRTVAILLQSSDSLQPYAILRHPLPFIQSSDTLSIFVWHPLYNRLTRGGGLGSRPKKMYGKRLGDGVEYHLMSPTPRC